MRHFFDREGNRVDRLSQPRHGIGRAVVPADRVMVLIDDPNVSQVCGELFDHGAVHPVLLAQLLVGAGRLVGIRFYADIPDRGAFPDRAAMVARRNAALASLGVVVVERALR